MHESPHVMVSLPRASVRYSAPAHPGHNSRSSNRGHPAEQAIQCRAQNFQRIRSAGPAAPRDVAVRSNQYRAIGVDAVNFVPGAAGVAEIAVLAHAKNMEWRP